MRTTPRNSPRKKDQVTPKRLRPLVQPGNETAQRDQQRGRHARVQRAGAEGAQAPGMEAKKLTTTAIAAADGADHGRPALHPQHPALGHEDVGGVDRAEDEGERAGDVERRRQDPQVGREGLARRDAGGRVQGIAGRGDRTVSTRTATTAEAISRMAVASGATSRRAARGSPRASATAATVAERDHRQHGRRRGRVALLRAGQRRPGC